MEAYERRTEILKALGHPVRLQTLDILRGKEQCVCHIEAVLKLRQSYISQQLMMLRRAGLVADRQDGLRARYHITDRAVFRVLDPARSMVEREGLVFASVQERAADGCPGPRCASASRWME